MLGTIIGILIAVIAIGVKCLYDYKRNLSINQLLQEKASLETAKGYYESELARLKQLVTDRDLERQNLLQDKFALETKVALANQLLEEHKLQLEREKDDRQKYLELTRAAIFEEGAKLSSKLLDDHKRENETILKTNQQRIEQTTNKLHEEYKHIFESMHNLHQKIGKVEIIERALLNPQGAGSLAEITLENIFKASGLIDGQDYQLQCWVEKDSGGGAKPDAVVFLPNNHIMVVDSKASKFFTEIEQQLEGEDKKRLESALKQTMLNHLKTLIHRNYYDAVREQFLRRNPGLNSNDCHITIMMFLPSESAVERLRKIDSNFEEKAWVSNIYPVGPVGLVNSLIRSKHLIAVVKQERQAKFIIEEVKNLLGSVAKLFALSENMGKSIKGSLEKYDKFAASFNSNFLSKARKLHKSGVVADDNLALKKLERYQLISNIEIIDNEIIEEIELEKIEEAA